MLRLTVFALLALTSSAFAAKVTVSLPDGGPYLGWAAEGPGAPPAKAVRTRSTQIDLETTDYPGAKFVYVQDESSGKVAKLPLKANVETVTIAAKDFARLFKADVTVTRGGATPIDAAVVSIDGQKAIIGAASQGVATFYDVPTGDVKVKVEYNIGKLPATPIVQIVDLSKPVSIQAAGEVSMAPKSDGGDAGSAVGPGAATEAKPKVVKENSPNPIGSMLVTLGAVAVIAGLGYAALRYYKQNSGTVNEQLERLGVQIPKAPDDDLTSGDPAAPPAFKTPQPVQKIVLDPVSPVDLSAAAAIPTITQAVASAGYPSLLTADGETLAVNEGETIVGREAGLGLSLTGETSVSRNHAKFVRVGNQVTLEDLGSTNGSFVNGSKLTAATVLRPGDEIRFGAITFRYQG